MEGNHKEVRLHLETCKFEAVKVLTQFFCGAPWVLVFENLCMVNDIFLFLTIMSGIPATYRQENGRT